MTSISVRRWWLSAALVIASFFTTTLWFGSQKDEIVSNANLDADSFKCPGCNVIFLNIELLRADYTGLIGRTSYTPAIDDFFKNSIIFHKVSAPGGETFLSNTAVQTGVHPHRIRISGIDVDSLNNAKPKKFNRIKSALTRHESWAEMLQKNGYHTLGINQGTRAGSGVFLDRGFDDYTNWSKKTLFEDMVSQLRKKLFFAPKKPLYLLFRSRFLHNYQYRLPAIPEWLDRLKIEKSSYSYKTPGGNIRTGFHLERNKKLSEDAQLRMERLIYRGVLEYGDKQIDRVFNLLKQRFLANSIIVLYANHGSGLGDNDIYAHGTSFQASVHVPLLIRHPNIKQPVHVYSKTALFDLVPTISKMIGIDQPDWSMLETYDQTILRGHGLSGQPIVGKNSWDEYIRLDDWKLIIRHGNQRFLFNIKEDPSEENNLYYTQEDKAAELEVMLKSYKQDLATQFGDEN